MREMLGAKNELNDEARDASGNKEKNKGQERHNYSVNCKVDTDLNPKKKEFDQAAVAQ